MNICHSGHEPICHMNNYCPICELKIEKDEIEEELKDALEKIKDLEGEIYDYNHRHDEPEHEKGD